MRMFFLFSFTLFLIGCQTHSKKEAASEALNRLFESGRAFDRQQQKFDPSIPKEVRVKIFLKQQGLEENIFLQDFLLGRQRR